MRRFHTLLFFAFLTALPAGVSAQAPELPWIASKLSGDGAARIDFFVASSEKGDSEYKATIRSTGETVYFIEMINVNKADIAHISAVTDANGQPAIKLEFENAAKRNMTTVTKNNIGNRLAICVDNEVISAPKIQSTISSEAIITGKFTANEVANIVRQLAPPKLTSHLVLIKSDWIGSTDSDTIEVDLRAALKGAVVPQGLVDKLPDSGPDILFPNDMISCYKPEQYAKLMAWLRARDLLVTVTDFPNAVTEEQKIAIASEPYIKRLGPIHTATLVQPVDVFDATSLFEPFATNQPFVTHTPVFQWEVTLQKDGAQQRVKFERQAFVQELKRGRPSKTQFTIDAATHETTVPDNHIWIMNAFPGTEDSEYRNAAKQRGFLPLVVAGATFHISEEVNIKPQALAPDAVESIVVNHTTSRSQATVSNSEKSQLPSEEVAPRISFTVTGAVKKPATYHDFNEGILILDALAVAGGLKEDAGDSIMITRQATNGENAYSIKVSLVEASRSARYNLPLQSGDVLTVAERKASLQEIRVFQLKYITHSDATDVLSQVFARRMADNSLSIVGDQGTNSIIVRSEPRMFMEIHELVKVLDVPSERDLPTPDVDAHGNPIKNREPQGIADTTSATSQETTEPLAPDGILGLAASTGQVESTIGELRKMYDANEHTARKTANKLKELKSDQNRSNTTVGLEKLLEERLRKEVAKSFELREAIHQAQLRAMEHKIRQTQQTIAQRRRIKDDIIARRAADLIDPNLQWKTSPHTEILDRQPSQTEPVARTPIDELAAYRTFLWDSLGPLQHERNHLLSSIASVEQSIVYVDPNVEVPPDADVETKKRLEQEQQVRKHKLAQLADRMKALREELEPVERQIALLKQKLADSSPKQVALEGRIVSVDDNQAEVSIGIDDGISKGSKLPVFRGEDYVGDIEIVEVADSKSIARILHDSANPPIRSGDRVTMLLDALAAQVIGQDPGESIYNDRLKRFKFKLDNIEVTSSAEMAEVFWLRYQGRGYPAVTGVWSDPRTNSLIIVGPHEADQPIRDTIAEWEGQMTGVEFREDESLEAQQKRFERRRKTTLEQIAAYKIEMIDAEQAGETLDGDRLKQLIRNLDASQADLATIERKLSVIAESIKGLQSSQQSP